MSGYLSSPALSENHLAFVCEDALWIVERGGKVARRLTSGAEIVRNPCFSADGTQFLFESVFEGIHQIYTVAVAGGVPSRVTHAAVPCFIVGCRQGGGLVYRSSKSSPLPAYSQLYEDPLTGAESSVLPVGRAVWIDFCDSDPHRVVLGLNQVDNARWKNYRGGTAGDVWTGDLAQGYFQRLFPQYQPGHPDASGGNPVLPTWCGDRIYFLDDRDGCSNLWSCSLNGEDFHKHTQHADYYLRRLRRFGSTLVYQCGAELYQFDTESQAESKIELQTHVGGAHLQRKFITIEDSRQFATLRGDHKRLAVCARGKLLHGHPWGGAVLQPGEIEGVRYRLPTWLEGVEGEQRPLLVVSDAGGEEALELYEEDSCEPLFRYSVPGVRRYEGLLANPRRPGVVVSDVGGRLIWVDFSDLENITHKELDRARTMRIADATWSGDGRWLARACRE